MSHRAYAWPHVEEMQAFDALPAHVQRELRRTGESALAYLELQRRRQWDNDW